MCWSTARAWTRSKCAAGRRSVRMSWRRTIMFGVASTWNCRSTSVDMTRPSSPTRSAIQRATEPGACADLEAVPARARCRTGRSARSTSDRGLGPARSSRRASSATSSSRTPYSSSAIVDPPRWRPPIGVATGVPTRLGGVVCGPGPGGPDAVSDFGSLGVVTVIDDSTRDDDDRRGARLPGGGSRVAVGQHRSDRDRHRLLDDALDDHPRGRGRPPRPMRAR